MKKKMLISFSGGETSAYMAQWLWFNKADDFDMKFVFANTGQEREETLEFIKECEDHFGFKVEWIEGYKSPIVGEGTEVKVVDYKTANRDGAPFEALIQKFGIPNQAAPFCSEHLKRVPIERYMRQIGWKDAFVAIGIRSDEVDRMSASRKEKNIIYPLIEFIPTTKPEINNYWRKMPFRLRLKGYEGNCSWCWKKSKSKLIRIAKDNPEFFHFPLEMEKKYHDRTTEAVKNKRKEKGLPPVTGNTFFRNNTSAKDILKMAQIQDPIIKDDSQIYTVQARIDFGYDDENESCEVWAQCGIDN